MTPLALFIFQLDVKTALLASITLIRVLNSQPQKIHLRSALTEAGAIYLERIEPLVEEMQQLAIAHSD
ncbi:MAG: hypothetical protein MJA27_02225 [Pseudanabaenales cyanobacterium]|nr:hypothetical protein [Pseudanabaenales cyanobacterium]